MTDLAATPGLAAIPGPALIPAASPSPSLPPVPADLDALAALLSAGRVAVLSGAGLSTESGIPDYRGPTGLARRAGPPMTYQAFIGSAAARQRYWARSHVGWRHIVAARPNAGHRAVAELGRRGQLTGIITQNVDGLHQAAGARDIIELHGSLSRVRCLGCGQRTARLDLDRRLRAANPDWASLAATTGPTSTGPASTGPTSTGPPAPARPSSPMATLTCPNI